MSYKLEYRTICFGVDPASRQPTLGIEGAFFIPSYQRGYRWTADEVTKLGNHPPAKPGAFGM